MHISECLIKDKYIPDIIREYNNRDCKYMQLPDEERYYLLKNAVIFKGDEYMRLVHDMDILNTEIMKKVVYKIMMHYKDGGTKSENEPFYAIMRKLGFSSKKMADAIAYTFYKKIKTKTYKDIPLTHFGRFDLIIDSDLKLKVVEQNSETPAGFPETSLSHIPMEFIESDIRNKYDNANENFLPLFFNSFSPWINQIRSIAQRNKEDFNKKKIRDISDAEILFVIPFSNDNTTIHDVLYRKINAIRQYLQPMGLDLHVDSPTIVNSIDTYGYTIDKRVLDDLERVNKMFSKSDRFISIMKIESIDGNISNIYELEFTDGEDFTNALLLTEFFLTQFKYNSNVNVECVDVKNIEVTKTGLYYLLNGRRTKIDYMYSFYPFEWFSEDKGGNEFWSAYMAGSFEIMNNPLTLITQSKAFWAYLFENINQFGFTKSELAIINDYIPRYSFEYREGTISKPVLAREGYGIEDTKEHKQDKTKEGVTEIVYQDKVEQMLFVANEFVGDINSEKTIDVLLGFLTIGLYYGATTFSENNISCSYIGNYTRFCERLVTDWSAYYISTFLEK